MRAGIIRKIAHAIWICVRLIVFGVGGFWLMLLSSVSFFCRIMEHDQHVMSPFLCVPLAVVSAFMMLFGTGQWKRWAYLWVFFAIPGSFLALALIPGVNDEGALIAVVTLATLLTNALVKAYYQRKSGDTGLDPLHEPDPS